MVTIIRYTEKEKSISQSECFDCGLPYGDLSWIEAVVPNDIWALIQPRPNTLEWQGAGLLCINCMAKRCAALSLENVPVKLTAGPFIMQKDDKS